MGMNTGGEPAPAVKETATLAGGCFWCLEAVFLELKGVESVRSGYCGGHVANPTYAQVCTGETGHAEAVQVSFNPRLLSYHDLLTIFFTIHDPTSLNRQGADVGTQYRSAIFHHDQVQQNVAHQVMREISAAGLWEAPLVTEVVPLEKFYPAEDYHQDYFKKNPFQPYCRVVIAPKITKFRHQFVDRLKK
jgi:peptide-methionine (S)-S-oxide reductase